MCLLAEKKKGLSHVVQSVQKASSAEPDSKIDTDVISGFYPECLLSFWIYVRFRDETFLTADSKDGKCSNIVPHVAFFIVN